MTKRTSMIITAAICAALSIGTGACSLSNHGNESSQSGNSAANSNTESPFKFVADNVEGDLQTELEGSDNVPSMTVSYSQFRQSDGDGQQVLAAESGWYCNPLFSGGCGMTIYVDEATGQHTPLCSRPECTHDTEYCEAHNSQFEGIPYAYYDGYLYGVAADTKTVADHTAAVGESFYETDRGEICLMRYAPDGTELKKLCKLQDALQESIDHAGILSAEIIGHKGALWISIEFDRQYGVYVTNEVVSSITEYATGYALLHYDIAKDKLTTVIEVPLSASQTKLFPPTHLCASGDYLYFRKANVNWADPYNGDLIYRVNIRTGAIEEVANAVCTTFAIGNNKLVYLPNGAPRIVDLQTGETTHLFADSEVLYDNIQCTEEYVILVTKNPSANIAIYNWQGDLLTTIQQPAIEPDDQTEASNTFSTTIAVSGDRLYGLCSAGGIYALYDASLSEAIAKGAAEWNIAYDQLALLEICKSYAN